MRRSVVAPDNGRHAAVQQRSAWAQDLNTNGRMICFGGARVGKSAYAATGARTRFSHGSVSSLPPRFDEMRAGIARHHQKGDPMAHH